MPPQEGEGAYLNNHPSFTILYHEDSLPLPTIHVCRRARRRT